MLHKSSSLLLGGVAVITIAFSYVRNRSMNRSASPSIARTSCSAQPKINAGASPGYAYVVRNSASAASTSRCCNTVQPVAVGSFLPTRAATINAMDSGAVSSAATATGGRAISQPVSQ